MEVNKDEALRCLSIAKQHLSNGNQAGALKFTKKSIGLYPTDQAKSFLSQVQESAANASSAKTTGANIHPGRQSSASSSTPSTPTAEKKHTPEQAKAVKTILSCGTDYYKVLSLTKSCTEVEIKKSYRKVSATELYWLLLWVH